MLSMGSSRAFSFAGLLRTYVRTEPLDSKRTGGSSGAPPRGGEGELEVDMRWRPMAAVRWAAAAGAAGRVILFNRALRAYIGNDGTGQRGRAGAGAAGTESTPLSGRPRVERAPRKRAGDRQ